MATQHHPLLNKETRIHKDDRPNQCSHCDKGFRLTSDHNPLLHTSLLLGEKKMIHDFFSPLGVKTEIFDLHLIKK